METLETMISLALLWVFPWSFNFLTTLSKKSQFLNVPDQSKPNGNTWMETNTSNPKQLHFIGLSSLAYQFFLSSFLSHLFWVGLILLSFQFGLRQSFTL